MMYIIVGVSVSAWLFLNMADLKYSLLLPNSASLLAFSKRQFKDSVYYTCMLIFLKKIANIDLHKMEV